MQPRNSESARYSKVSTDDYFARVDQFISSQGDGGIGVIPDAEFDRLFDLVERELNGIGRFDGEGRLGDGIDFCSSRYVDQIPLINVVLNGTITLRKLINVGIRIQNGAHRPFCLSFEDEKDHLAVFPDASAIGTLDDRT